jgi:hypothetical protein
MPGPTFACGGCGDLEGQGYDRSGFSSAGSSMIWTSMVIDRRYKIKLHRYPFAGSVLVCVAPGFSPACAALKGGATLETRTLPVRPDS